MIATPGQAPTARPRDSAELRTSGQIRMAADAPKIQEEALAQLRNAARLPDVKIVVGLPDLHPGNGIPVGAVIATANTIYPHLVGNDIGCGIGVWKTGIAPARIDLSKFEKRLRGFESTPMEDPVQFLEKHGAKPSGFEGSLGSIGGGNHFAELQVFKSVEDPNVMAKFGLSSRESVLVVHSGSRAFGQHIREGFGHGAEGLAVETPRARGYLALHDQANSWARANRAAIAERMLARLGRETDAPLLDISHNFVTPTAVDGETLWLHRKGAAQAKDGLVLVPGSRGTLSYLVQPLAGVSESLFSIAHGAGRKWSRSSCRERLEDRFSPEALRRTDYRGLVICDDKDLLYQEAPQAYNNIDFVVEQLVKRKLVKVVATLHPILTYKSAASSDD